MSIKTLIAVNQLLNRECAALQWFVNQFDEPSTASTPEGRRVALRALGESLLRTNQLLNTLVAEVGTDAVEQQLAEAMIDADTEDATVILMA